MKTLKELKGVKELSKTEQKAINGGRWACRAPANCESGHCCIYGACVPGYESNGVCQPQVTPPPIE